MFILNKETGKLYNLDKVMEIIVGRAGNTISVGMEGGVIRVFADYDTEAEAKEAVCMLAEMLNTGKREVLALPDKEEVRNRLRHRKEVYHHATGKKTKGHGGS